ncbi:MAG: hypothetical protein IKU59_07770 [Bacteroidales bacterium]|nr:hypothetical protein [Bacteroidales bacterium]
MPLDEFEKIYNDGPFNYTNKFSKWITNKDTTILEFLMLAKTNEYIRSRINSAWYYPTMTFGTKISIEEVLEMSLASKDKRLRDRYLLQAVRALTTLGRYEECVELWEKDISKLPEGNIMRRLALPYIAGAEFRIGKSEKWIEYFAQLGDVSSIMYCSKIRGKELSYIEAFAEVCSYHSNDAKITSMLQAHVRDVELDLCWAKTTYDSPYDPKLVERVNRDIDKLRTLSLEMLKDKKIKNKALWYYTLAFLTDLKGDYLNASSYLAMAERCVKDDYLRDSIKVLRIYLDAKIYKYDASYEAKLFEQLKWLDNKIATNINKEVEQKVAEGASEMEYGLSFYYWNDMLRRILLSEVAPRMIAAGKSIRALQLANMADNRLLLLVNKRDTYKWVESYSGDYERQVVRSYTMEEYRYSDYYNRSDYSNDFFKMIDTLGVKVANNYLIRTQNPKTEFDRFLNKRGYINSDYLNDIIGTQYLREMKYAKALSYFKNVDESYKDHLNVWIDYDPFSEKRVKYGKDNYFKLSFAKEMCRLEKSIKYEQNPNKKAKLMVKYAIGIRNSFGFCWGLTQYYKGWRSYLPKEKYAPFAKEKAKEIVAEAMAMVTDYDVASELNYQLCNFKTVAEKYPETEKGRLVRGECDKLIDYHAESYLEKNYWDQY